MQNKSQTSGKHVYKYGNVLLKIFINIILKRDPCIFFFFFTIPLEKRFLFYLFHKSNQY